jgi:circadian clock protein KaiB
MLQVARAAGCLQNVHVVVLSATVDPVGVEGYQVLRKPVDLSVLFTALDEAVVSLQKQIEAACEPLRSETSAVVLTLYVTGRSHESTRAVRNLRRVLQEFEGRPVTLVVCDVMNLPEGAAAMLEMDRVVVTPTLVRQHPEPKVWIVGDLSKDEQVNEVIASGLDQLAELPPAGG